MNNIHQKPINTDLFDKSVMKDFTNKIETKLFCKEQDNKTVSSDINKLIILLNYCFLNKNDFFIENFNRYYIKSISQFYHELKINILDVELNGFTSFAEFVNLNKNPKTSKLIKFICKSYLIKFNDLVPNNDITNVISEKDMKRILSYM